MIFGTSNIRLSGSITLDLEYSNITPNYIVEDENKYTSVITGHKSFLNKIKNYSTFDIDVNLFKNVDTADEVFDKLIKLKNERFYFYPHIDELPLHDIYGSNIFFHITEMKPYYILQDTKYDAIKLKIVSEGYTYLGNNVAIDYGYGTNYGTGFYGLTGW